MYIGENQVYLRPRAGLTEIKQVDNAYDGDLDSQDERDPTFQWHTTMNSLRCFLRITKNGSARDTSTKL